MSADQAADAVAIAVADAEAEAVEDLKRCVAELNSASAFASSLGIQNSMTGTETQAIGGHLLVNYKMTITKVLSVRAVVEIAENGDEFNVRVSVI